MNPFSRVVVASIFLLLVFTSLFPVAQSTSIRPTPGPGFEGVYVVIKDRLPLEGGDNNAYLLELEVIGNYDSEDGKATLSNGEILLSYDFNEDLDYHELDEDDVLKVDINLFEPHGPIILPDKYVGDTLITINSIEKTTLPPSLWKYHTPPMLILVVITAFIVLVIMIILVFFLKRSLKKVKTALKNESKIEYES